MQPIGVQKLSVGNPSGLSKLVGIKLGLPLELIVLQAPNMAGDINFATPLLEVVEVARQSPQVDALLVHLQSDNLNLAEKLVTSRPISSKSSRLQASMSAYLSSHWPPGKTMLST